MGMEAVGKLHTIFETKQVSERFTKREFVVEALPQTGGYRSLSEGQRVQFDIVQERGKDRAANVVLL